MTKKRQSKEEKYRNTVMGRFTEFYNQHRQGTDAKMIPVVDQHRTYSLKRLNKLAQPKRDLMDETSRPHRHVSWGNQEPIVPIRISSGPTRRPSTRISDLAKPKKSFATEAMPQAVVLQRPWSSRPSSTANDNNDRVTQTRCSSARINELARPSQRHTVTILSEGEQTMKKHRDQQRARTISYTRLSELAEPKSRPDWSNFYQTSRGLPKAIDHEYIEHLAKPKYSTKKVTNITGVAATSVSKGALKYKISDRIRTLAQPAKTATEWMENEDAYYAVRVSALSGKIPERIEELSRPSVRHSNRTPQINLNAFTVSEAAKKAVCTQRVSQLAQAIR